MNVPFLDLKWQHAQIKEQVEERFNNIFSNTSFILGPDVGIFEEHFAQYVGAKHCIGVSGGTTALSLAIESLGLPKGSEIMTLPTSFFASASAIVHAGHIPTFSDIDMKTGNFDYKELAKNITDKTRAIVAVHLYGRPADMEVIENIAKSQEIEVIEDAAQAHGASYKNIPVGTFGKAGCFSFYPGKNLGAYGDAGAVVTNDEHTKNIIKRLRNHGCLGKYDHELVGYNAKLDSLQAAVLDEKLRYLNEWNEMRRKIAACYDGAFEDLDGIEIVSPDTPNTVSARHLYPVRVTKGDREEIMNALKEKGIATGIHYPDPLHLLPAFSSKKWKEGTLPKAEKFAKELVSLPIYPGMSTEQVDYVIESVKSVIKNI